MIEPYQPTMSPTGDVAAYVPPDLRGFAPLDPSTVSFPSMAGIPTTAPPSVTLESGFPGVAPLNFNFAEEQRKAYESLKPFYDKLLSFTGGRLDLAKRVMEYTYQQGMRESQQEYQQRIGELDIADPREKEQLQTAQNRRGILESGFGATERGRQTEQQGLRREAVERALEGRESRLSAERGFGLEEKQRGFAEERFGLERERRGEASGMTKDVLGVKSQMFQSQLGKAAQDEARRVREKETGALSSLYGGGGTSNILGSAKEYAESGRQSELDQLRKQGKVNF